MESIISIGRQVKAALYKGMRGGPVPGDYIKRGSLMKQLGKNFFSGAVSRMGLVLVLATAMAVGVIGMAGAANPVTAPVVHATYVIHNDADSGANGYWALDNFTAQVTIWKTGADTYQVNMTNTGIWCTFAGSPTPGVPAATQTAPECGSMEGGYDGNLTTSVPLVNASTTTLPGSPFDAGGTEVSGAITPGSFSGQFGWIGYFFPGATSSDFAFANGGNAWNWTYIAPNGNKWVDSGPDAGSLVTDGQISSTYSGSVVGSADIIPTTCSLSAAGGISFGDVTPGAGLVYSTTGPVTVTNDGNAGTGVSIYGSNWSNNPSSVGWTQWQAGTSLTSGTALGYAPGADTGVSLAGFGGSTQYSFGLDVPLSAVGGQHTQTITFVSQC